MTITPTIASGIRRATVHDTCRVARTIAARRAAALADVAPAWRVTP